MLKKQVSKTAVELLGEQIKEAFDPIILERGLEYQQKGFVYNTDIISDTMIRAKVQGTRTYDVSIALNDLEISSCSCPYDGYCKHMAAVFFYIYAIYGHPDHFVRGIKQSYVVENVRIAPYIKSARWQSSFEQIEEDSEIPQESDSAAIWQQFFERRYTRFSEEGTIRQGTDAFLSALLQTLLKHAQYWKADLRLLYSQFVVLFILQKVEHLYRQHERDVDAYYVSYRYNDIIRYCMDQLRRILPEQTEGLIYEKYRSTGEELMQLLTGKIALLRGGAPVDWILVYRMIWWYTLNAPQWRDMESARLKELLQDEGDPSESKIPLVLALAHLEVIGGSDEQAFAVLEEMSNNTGMDDFTYYLHTFAERNNQHRLLHWLRYLAPQLRRANNSNFNLFCKYWHGIADSTEVIDELMQVLTALLPRSYPHYTDLLLKSGRYEDWTNFHLAHGISPIEIHPADLRVVESRDVSLLLPLYHQSVVRHILQKNRKSYRMAVRLLRKLKEYYARLNNTTRYTEYIESLIRQYARLRALQEEFRKGKLLT